MAGPVSSSPPGGNLGRRRRGLVYGRGDLEHDPEIQRTYLQEVLVLEFALPLDRFVVDVGAVRAAEVAHEGLAPPHQEGTMPLADHLAGRAQLTLLVPADQELLERDGDALPPRLALRQHHQTELHV